MAAELVTRNNIPNPFKDGNAGYYWLYGFLRRFPELTVRKPENTSLHRSRSFNKTNVDKFFHIYDAMLS